MTPLHPIGALRRARSNGDTHATREPLDFFEYESPVGSGISLQVALANISRLTCSLLLERRSETG